MADSAEGRQVHFPPLTDAHRRAGEGDARAAGRGRQSARLPHLHLEQRAGDDGDLHRHGVGRLRPQHAGARFPAQRPLLGRRLVADGRRLRGGAEGQRRARARSSPRCRRTCRRSMRPSCSRAASCRCYGIAEAMDAAEAAAFIGEAWREPSRRLRSVDRRPAGRRRRGGRRQAMLRARLDEAEAKAHARGRRPVRAGGAPRRQCRRGRRGCRRHSASRSR